MHAIWWSKILVYILVSNQIVINRKLTKFVRSLPLHLWTNFEPHFKYVKWARFCYWCFGFVHIRPRTKYPHKYTRHIAIYHWCAYFLWPSCKNLFLHSQEPSMVWLTKKKKTRRTRRTSNSVERHIKRELYERLSANALKSDQCAANIVCMTQLRRCVHTYLCWV